MRRSIRQRLLTVVFLGVITSAVSLFALVRILSITTQQRVDRARESVSEELEALKESPSRAGALPVLPTISTVGLRGGYFSADPSEADLPKGWIVPFREAKRSGSLLEVPLENGTLVIGAQPLEDTTVAWAGMWVRRPPYLRTWQAICVILTLATALLVTSALRAVVIVKRGAQDLNASFDKLASDLFAEIPRPPIRELSDVADGIANLARRLAEAREVEARLNKELADRERLAALGRVVAGVAHEVRNPLASIKLRLDLAAASGSLPSAAEKAIAHATAEITRLDQLVADLLIVSGRALGPKQAVPLGPLVRARAEALAPWAAERKVSIAVSGDVTADVDQDSLTRAIDNLLRNAVEASPERAEVAVSLVQSDRAIAVRVEDRGSGVAADRARELFEPFFTTKSGGTGLGLAISRSIARAHGGDLSYSRQGSVTRFEIVLHSTPREAAA
jgi:signal transduction histidine kinase